MGETQFGAELGGVARPRGSKRSDHRLPPGTRVSRQALIVIDHPDLVRRVRRPVPEHDVDVRRDCTFGEAGNNDTCRSGSDKTLRDRPGRRFDPAGRQILPWAGEIRRGDPMRRQG